MNVHARFRLDKVTRGQGYVKASASVGDFQAVDAANVSLSAVQGEPFGAATPSGKVEMFIVNPAAAQVFFDAAIGQEFDFIISPAEKSE